MSLRLEVLTGKAIGEKLSIDDGLVFGRLGDQPGRLGGDPELSRRHAAVTLAPTGQYSIEDLSSTNGTYVNGERVEGRTLLTAGDMIDLGATKLIVREAPAPRPPPPAPVDVRTASTIVDFIPGAPLTPPDEPAPGVPGTPLADSPAPAPPVAAPATPAPESPTHPDVAPPTPVLEPPTEAKEPAATERPGPSPAVPLDVRVVVNFEAREAEIGFPGWAAPIRLRHQDGRWRVSNLDS